MLALCAAGSAPIAWPRLAAAQASALTVGAGKIEPQAEAYYGADSGIFAQHGLNVEVKTLLNAGVTASAVAGGDVQIGIQTTLGIAQAHQNGVPFVVIASAALADTHYPTGALVVDPNGPIKSAKDLNGKTVAVETLHGLAQLTVLAKVDEAGGTSSTLQFLELPATLMPDAVLQGRVQGAVLQDPVLSTVAGKFRSLGNPNDAIGDQFVTLAWFTTTDWLAKNKDTARRFADAIYAAGQWAMANPTLAAAALNKHLGIQEAAAKQRFATRIDPAQYRSLFAIAAKYGMIKPINPLEIVWDGK